MGNNFQRFYQIKEKGEHENKLVICISWFSDTVQVWDGKQEITLKRISDNTDTDIIEILATDEILILLNKGVINDR